jgi:hypothetical protein
MVGEAGVDHVVEALMDSWRVWGGGGCGPGELIYSVHNSCFLDVKYPVIYPPPPVLVESTQTPAVDLIQHLNK